MNFTAFFAAERGIILAGQLPVAEQRTAAEAILAISRRTGWPIFADALSGLRGHPGVIQHADLILHRPPQQAPERLLHFGESYASKRISQWLRDLSGPDYWQVHAHSEMRDPFFQNPTVLHAGIAEFVSQVPECRGSAWIQAWRSADQQVEQLCAAELDRTLSEPAAARIVARQAAKAGGLFLGNSMPIRDFDAFAFLPLPVPTMGNRGASGIDGNLATAAGAAAQLGRPVVALVGDLTALHDLNSLAFLQTAPVIVVIINNQGGGIFRFLPLAVTDGDRQTYWETPHRMTFSAAAAQFGLGWEASESPDELERGLEYAIRERKSFLFEVRTDRAENLARHQRFADAVKGWPLWQP